jgi:hypothetical protein
VLAWKCNLANRHDAPARTCRSSPTAESRGAQYACGNDPTINDADSAWNGRALPIRYGLNAPDACVGSDHGVVKVHDHDAVICNAVCEEALDAAVCPNGAMAIKVIDGYVRKDAHIDCRVE